MAVEKTPARMMDFIAAWGGDQMLRCPSAGLKEWFKASLDFAPNAVWAGQMVRAIMVEGTPADVQLVKDWGFNTAVDETVRLAMLNQLVASIGPAERLQLFAEALREEGAPEPFVRGEFPRLRQRRAGPIDSLISVVLDYVQEDPDGKYAETTLYNVAAEAAVNRDVSRTTVANVLQVLDGLDRASAPIPLRSVAQRFSPRLRETLRLRGEEAA